MVHIINLILTNIKNFTQGSSPFHEGMSDNYYLIYPVLKETLER